MSFLNGLHPRNNFLAITFSTSLFLLGAPANREAIYQTDGSRFRSNLIFGYILAIPGEHSVAEDPRFVRAAALVKFKPGGYPFNKAGFEKTIAGFQTTKSSPMIDRGVVICNSGGQYLWGNPLYNGAAKIGVHEN
jgi:hypothetical protein